MNRFKHSPDRPRNAEAPCWHADRNHRYGRTLPPSVLRRRRARDPLPAEFIRTDHQDARSAVTRLIQDLGLTPFFAGGASDACLTETGGPPQSREIDVADATAAFARAVGTNW